MVKKTALALAVVLALALCLGAVILIFAPNSQLDHWVRGALDSSAPTTLPADEDKSQPPSSIESEKVDGVKPIPTGTGEAVSSFTEQTQAWTPRKTPLKGLSLLLPKGKLFVELSRSEVGGQEWLYEASLDGVSYSVFLKNFVSFELAKEKMFERLGESRSPEHGLYADEFAIEGKGPYHFVVIRNEQDSGYSRLQLLGLSQEGGMADIRIDCPTVEAERVLETYLEAMGL